MRWTLGLACLCVACFGEAVEPGTTNAADTTTTDGATTTTTAMTETDAATATSIDNPVTSGPPDTESSGADTTAGDMCGQGMAPNPPVPQDWIGPVFVGMSGPGRMPCPAPLALVASGYLGIGPTDDECECRCLGDYTEVCNIQYGTGQGCPLSGGDQQLVQPCTALPRSTSAVEGSGSGSTCDPIALIPKGDAVHVCAGPEPSEDPCIDLVPDLRGPCIMREDETECPPELDAVDVGLQGSCDDCPGNCSIAAHCTTPVITVYSDEACTDVVMTFSDGQCHDAVDGAVSIGAAPTVPQTCGTSTLITDGLTVCCPPMP